MLPQRIVETVITNWLVIVEHVTVTEDRVLSQPSAAVTSWSTFDSTLASLNRQDVSGHVRMSFINSTTDSKRRFGETEANATRSDVFKATITTTPNNVIVRFQKTTILIVPKDDDVRTRSRGQVGARTTSRHELLHVNNKFRFCLSCRSSGGESRTDDDDDVTTTTRRRRRIPMHASPSLYPPLTFSQLRAGPRRKPPPQNVIDCSLSLSLSLSLTHTHFRKHFLSFSLSPVIADQTILIYVNF